MFFCGYDFINASTSIDTPSSEDTTKVRIADAYFDDLYITTDYDYSDSALDWDSNTILYASYAKNYEGSNGFDTSQASMLRVRRRESVNSPWITVLQRPIVTAADYSIDYYDRYARAGKEYQYIIVPVNSAGTEGQYVTANMSKFEKCTFDGIVVCDVSQTWFTRLNCSYTKQRNIQTSTITTLASKYPYQIQNAYVNYWSGDVNGLFVPHTCNNFDLNGGNEYRNTFYDFLTDGMPKIIKTHDGEMWMVQIAGNVTEDDSYYKMPTTSFSWVQIGDAEDYDDLYYNGFIYTEDV